MPCAADLDERQYDLITRRQFTHATSRLWYKVWNTVSLQVIDYASLTIHRRIEWMLLTRFACHKDLDGVWTSANLKDQCKGDALKIAASVDCEKGKSRQKQPHNHKSKALLQSWRHTLEKHSLFEKNSSVVTRWGLHSNREAGQNDSIINEMVLHLFQLYRVSVSMPLVKLFIKYFISKKRVIETNL